MKERPIIFSSPMVRALLAGTKTQTRRVVKRHSSDCIGWFDAGGGNWRQRFLAADGSPYLKSWSDRCPYGQPGDRLWVREAWRITGESPEDTLDMFDRDDVQYRADDDQSYIDKYRPSIHMPRRFSRITLEVTAVRVERLQDISVTDAMAEGVVKVNLRGLGPCMEWRYAYEDLWTNINGPGSWDANPWVWVIEFRRVTP